MEKKFLAIVFFTAIILSLSSCGGADQSSPDDKKDPDVVTESDSGEVNSDKEDVPDFSEIENLFANIVPDSMTSVSLNSGKLYVKVETNLSSEEAPNEWEATMLSVEEALQAACETAKSYDAKTVYVEINSADDKIMASGFDSKIRYNMFADKSENGESNPPTITKFEYDQISVGMRLTEVREIIGGPGELQSQIGEVSKYSSPISTYRWYGTKEGSYADILFDGYEVYSKVELWLE